MPETKSPRNKTLSLSDEEKQRLKSFIIGPEELSGKTAALPAIENKIINGDLFGLLPRLPAEFADLIIIDPPYNMDKDFHGNRFRGLSSDGYREWVRTWLPAVVELGKKDATVYVCGDWKSSSALFMELEKICTVRNRITWQREKGRGASANWKNCSEDIWFATRGADYVFNVQDVMQRKKVIAPYRHNGEPKDWQDTDEGKYRLTHPSNFWDDITVPFWSMEENTEHPTQKPEKLVAKLILASSRPGDIVFDPFAGSGTTAVTAKKLGRRWVGIEQNPEYCLWAQKRLEKAGDDSRIQGYKDGCFLGRNEG
ncbi:MAG: site-specific DNA-methyltransferase [Spirochaetales bacterium]|nr:site-specific DNA-methyltransferase [Spirochaetales bacterium]